MIIFQLLDAGLSHTHLNFLVEFNFFSLSRILELEQDFKINNRNVKGEIELWDCSGDNK